MVKLSFGISGTKAKDEYVALAGLAEDYGFYAFSVFDDLMFKPAWPILYLVAQHTERILLGPSVCNPYLIHPALLAEYAAMLDEFSDGRAYMGIGRGAFLDFIDVQTPRAITTVREAIAMMKRLWRGDKSPYEGRVFRAGEAAHLTWEPPRKEIPIMVGTWGPKMCRMAGAAANEVKAGSSWSTRYAQYMRSHIEAGAIEAGRDPADVGLVLGPLTSISEDADEAQRHARQTLVFYLPYLAPMPEFLGVDPDVIERVQAFSRAGDMEAAGALISDELLGEFALYGTPADIVTKIEGMNADAPVTRIEFGMPHSPGGSIEAMHLLGKYVLPHFEQSN
jgi:5,10-methylenetetrahydromethanopterin reductase